MARAADYQGQSEGRLRHRTPRQRAFTLIELLVVIGIIGVLLSLSLIGASAAIAQARVIRCGSNLKNIGVAWQLYLDDNHEWFPAFRQHVWWYYGGRDPCLFDFSGLGMDHRPINPYLNLQLRRESDADTFRCPGDRPIYSTNDAAPGVTANHSAYAYFGNCYMLNHLLLYYDNPTTRVTELTRMSLGMIDVDHATLVLAGDCQWYYAVNNAPWDAQFHNDPDKVNLLFLDGHAAFTRIVRKQGITASYNFYPVHQQQIEALKEQ